MAEPVIPGLNSDGTIVPATIPATAELTAGQTVTVNEVDYRLVKYLGGGTYGKVWDVLDPSDYKYSIKIINVQEDTIAATNAVIKEAQLTKKLYDKTSLHPICSNIYGIGSTGNFVIIVMDVFEITLDWYLEHGGSARPEELILKFYKMLERVNVDGMQTSHGDVKGDNFMINLDGTLRAVDFGFGHIKEEGFEITCTSEFNSKNIGMNRDIVQFVVYLTLFYRIKVSKPLASSIAPIFLNIKKDTSLGEVDLWNKTYRYLNLEKNAPDINAVAKNIIKLVTPHNSQVVPLTLPVEEEEEEAPPVVTVAPPVVTVAPLPTPATIAATIEDKLTIKSSRTPAEVMARVEELVTEAVTAERLRTGKRKFPLAPASASEAPEAPEAKRKRTTGGARKTKKTKKIRRRRISRRKKRTL